MVFDDVDTINPPKPTPYKLPYFDRDSIKEIKDYIAKKKYKDAQTVKDHMEYLQHLSDKIQRNMAGSDSWELKKILEEVKGLYSILGSMLEKFK